MIFVNDSSEGYTLVELVVAIAIFGTIIVALSILFGSGVSSNRRQIEQFLINEDARNQLERMSDTIRDARDQDIYDWLVSAGESELQIATNIDADDDTELIRYFLDGMNLRRGVTESGQSESVRTVARNIINTDEAQLLFRYYDASGNEILPANASSFNVDRIEFALVIDTESQDSPGAGEIITLVKPRIQESNTTRLWEVVLDFPSNPTGGGAGDDVVTVTTRNPVTTTETVVTEPITAINDGRVATYTGDYFANLNYDATQANWFGWVGPITLGQVGGAPVQVVDKVPQSGFCFGSMFTNTLLTCDRRQVTASGITKQYLPILTYTQPTGELDYIGDITYGSSSDICLDNTECASGSCSITPPDSFFVGGQESLPQAVAAKGDGKVLFVVGTQNAAIYQYSLTSSWDFSTASYTGISFTVSGQDVQPKGLAVKSDGKKMFLLGGTTNTIYQYTLSSSWDLTTASYDGVSFSVSSQDTLMTGIAAKGDGKKVFTVGDSTDMVYQYSLTDSWDLTTASYDGVSLDISSQDTAPSNVYMKSSGSRMFLVGDATNTIYQYSVSNPWEVATASYDNVSFTVSSEDQSPTGIVFKGDGKKIVILGDETDTMYLHELGHSWDLSTVDYGVCDPL